MLHLPLRSREVCAPSAAVDRSWYAELGPFAAAARGTQIIAPIVAHSSAELQSCAAAAFESHNQLLRHLKAQAAQ